MHMMMLAYIFNALGLQVQSVVAREAFLHKGNSRGIGLEESPVPLLIAILQRFFFALCPQLHHVVVKHKVSY